MRGESGSGKCVSIVRVIVGLMCVVVLVFYVLLWISVCEFGS